MISLSTLHGVASASARWLRPARLMSLLRFRAECKQTRLIAHARVRMSVRVTGVVDEDVYATVAVHSASSCRRRWIVAGEEQVAGDEMKTARLQMAIERGGIGEDCTKNGGRDMYRVAEGLMQSRTSRGKTVCLSLFW